MKKTILLNESDFKKIIKKIVVEALKPSQFRKYVKEFNKERYSEIFKTLGDKYGHDKNYYRIYIPLLVSVPQGPVSDIQKEVTKFLEHHGYKVLDYVKGTAKYGDSKNTTTIGKVLTRLKSDVLMKRFISDESRKALTSDASNLMVVISRHPYDIAGSDTDRNWTNCMTMGHSDSPRVAKLNEELKELQYKLELLEAEYSNTPGFKKVKSSPNEDGEDTHGYLMTNEFLSSPLYKLIKRIGEVNSELEDRKEEGQNAKYLIHDVKEGSLISYLIRSDDKNIQNPIAVLNIKPYVKEYGEDFILVSDNNMYGQGRPEFKSTVDSILNEINGDVESGGYYCLSGKIYADSQPRRIFAMDKDVNKFYVAAQNYLKNNIEPIVESAFEENVPSAIDSAFETFSSDNDVDFDELYEHEDNIKKIINSEKQAIINSIIKTGDFDVKEDNIYFSYDLFKKLYPKDKDNVEKFVKYYFKDNQLEIHSIDSMLQEDLFSIAMTYLDDNFSQF